MQSYSIGLKARTACVLAVGVLLSACASTPPHNAKLADVQTRYQAASNSAEVARAAPKQLQEASQDLDKAEQLFKEGAPDADVDHYAYMASQRIAIAQEAARQQASEAKIKEADAIRGRLKEQQSAELARTTQAKNAQLQKQLEALKAEQTNRGLVLTLGNVLFELNKADLKPGGARTVNQLASFMRQYPKRNVMIEGYTDSTGSVAYNKALSERRAGAVRDALLADSINPQRIVTKGFGVQYPVATNTTAAGRQQNRRVEIVISDEDGEFKDVR